MYRRVLLKLSGEALEGTSRRGLDPEVLETVAREVGEGVRMGVQVALVVGGGNIFRGFAGAASGMNRSTADTMGMLATVINGLALEDALIQQGQPARVFSAWPVGAVVSAFSQREALACLEEGRVVVLTAGTGNPYFTTDTAAALRALELSADILLKATKVDGIYDMDPVQHPGARRYERLTYAQVLEQRLGVMDLTAVTLCQENRLPLCVFDMHRPGHIRRVILGEAVGTQVVHEDQPRG